MGGLWGSREPATSGRGGRLRGPGGGNRPLECNLASAAGEVNGSPGGIPAAVAVDDSRLSPRLRPGEMGRDSVGEGEGAVGGAPGYAGTGLESVLVLWTGRGTPLEPPPP